MKYMFFQSCYYHYGCPCATHSAPNLLIFICLYILLSTSCDLADHAMDANYAVRLFSALVFGKFVLDATLLFSVYTARFVVFELHNRARR